MKRFLRYLKRAIIGGALGYAGTYLLTDGWMIYAIILFCFAVWIWGEIIDSWIGTIIVFLILSVIIGATVGIGHLAVYLFGPWIFTILGGVIGMALAYLLEKPLRRRPFPIYQ